MMGLLQGLGKYSVLAWGDDFWDEILNLLVNQTIGPLLWGLCDIFLVILDLFEWIFEAFAGTLEGGVTVQGQTVEGDLVLFLIQSDVVTQLFISIMILSFILLLMFTIFAIVKNQYSEKQEPVTKIINGSFKALFMYLLVPVATVVCLLVGNIVLQAIDGGTNVANSTKASGMLFRAAAYNGNKLRDSSPSDAREDLQYWYDMNYLNVTTKNRIKDEVGITSSNIDTLEDYDDLYKIADIIDEQFANGDLATSNAWSFQVGGGLGLSGLGDSYWSYGTVCLFYDAFRLSYITIWVGGAFLIGSIGKICWGLISRLFKITIYYAISPAIMATFPIDNGKALGSWRSAMVQQATSAYCAVAAVNILYSILPVFNNIDIGGGLGGCIIKLFIMIIAFKSTDDLIKTISGWFGTGDALSDGKAAKDQVGLKNLSSKAMGTFTGIVGGAKAGAQLGKGKAGKFFHGVEGAITGAWQGSGLAEKSGLDPAKWAKDWKDGTKKGGDAYKDIKSNFGLHPKDNKAIFSAKDAIEDQSKGVEAKLAKLKAQFDSDVAGEPVGSAKYNAIKKRYDENVKRTKSDAAFVKPLFEAREIGVNAMKQDLEERTSNFRSLSDYYKNLEAEKDMRAKFNDTLKRKHALKDAFGNDRELTDDEWKKVKSGNLDVITHYTGRQEAEKMYSAYASDMAQIDRSLKEFKQDIKDLYDSGSDGQKYLQSVFGSGFAGDISTVADIKSAIETEQKAVNDLRKDFKKTSDDLIKDMADAYDRRNSLSEKELGDIGKGLKS